LATQSALRVAKQELLALKSNQTLSVSDIVKKLDEIEGLEKGEKAILALKQELFPEEVKS
jgi:hypothetical protein